jgi:hypothetical protein
VQIERGAVELVEGGENALRDGLHGVHVRVTMRTSRYGLVV